MLSSTFFARKRRVRARITGTAQRPRASILRSLTRTSVQLIDDTAGKTVAAVMGRPKKGQSKTAQAEAVGVEIAAIAKKQGITKVVFDRSGYRYHGRVQAVAEAMRAGGLEF